MIKKQIQNILIIQTASIGDVVLATPLIEKLKEYFPGAAIDFLLKKGIEGLFTSHPHLRKILFWDKSNDKYGNLKKLIRAIRGQKYDVVVNVQRFASSGLITALSGAPVRLGFSKNPLSVFYSRRLPHRISADPAKSQHETARNLSLIDSITDERHDYPIRLYPSQADFAKVSQFKTHKYICIAPTSLWHTKQYPSEKWVEFVKSLDTGMYVYFMGAPSDRDQCDKIITQSGHPNCMNLAGKLSFLESAALMKDASMNFVNDSAPQHFASAMNAPVTSIFCSTVPAFGFGPLSDDAGIVQIEHELYCRPCGLHGFRQCPEGHFKCALEIKNKQLLSRIN